MIIIKTKNYLPKYHVEDVLGKRKQDNPALIEAEKKIISWAQETCLDLQE